MKKAIIGFCIAMFALYCVLAQPVTAHAEEHEHPFCMATLNAEATCTENGEVCYTCAQCSHSWTETIFATGHLYDEGQVITEPTCSQNGIIAFTCRNCDEIIEERLPKTDHSYDDGVLVKEPDCEENGLMVYTCQDCGDVVEEVLPGGQHRYNEGVADEPDCTKDGQIVYTCLDCGHTYTEVIPAGEHSFDAGIVVTKPTCKEGRILFTCQRCGYTRTEAIPATEEHVIVDGKETKPATCIEDGIFTYYCKCGEAIEKPITERADHTYGELDENNYGNCTVCGKWGLSHEHVWGDWIITQMPTYEVSGEYTRPCTLCEKTYTLSMGCLVLSPEEECLEVMRLVNEKRAQHGVAPLTYRYEAQIAADVRMQEVKFADYHTRPDGSEFYTVLIAYDIPLTVHMGENLTGASTNPAGAVEAWYNSPPHRFNMLNGDYTSTVVGKLHGLGSVWVQLFFCDEIIEDPA